MPRDRTMPSGQQGVRAAPAPVRGNVARSPQPLQRVVGNAAASMVDSDQALPEPLRRILGNAAAASMVDSDQVLPQAVVTTDKAHSDRLVVRFGGDVVATIKVTGPDATVHGIQIRDLTGARNHGGKIEAVDLDIVHPPGWIVVVQPVTAGLARTKKAFGIGNVTATMVERRPPYRRDVELEMWPSARSPGTPLHQRRELHKDEEAARQAREREEHLRRRQLAALEKEYGRLTWATSTAYKYLMDLRDGNWIFQMMTKLPMPEHYNAIRRDLFLAGHLIDSGDAGGARTVLKRADAALWAANEQVNRAVRRGNENLETGIRAVEKIDAVVLIIGEEIARRIPPPIGPILVLIYELAKPRPKTLDEFADRLFNAHQTGTGFAPTKLPTEPETPGGAGTGAGTKPPAEPETLGGAGTGGGTKPPAEPETLGGAPGGGGTGAGSRTGATTEPAPGTTAAGPPGGAGAGGGTTQPPTPGPTQPGGSSSGSTSGRTSGPTPTPAGTTEPLTASTQPPARDVPGPGSTRTQSTRTQSTNRRPTPDNAGEQPDSPATASQRPTPTTAGRRPAPPSRVAGQPDEFLANRTARVANQTTPTLEVFDGFTKVRDFGGPNDRANGINVKYIIKDRQGNMFMFRPADTEAPMRYGPPLGIVQGERYRRGAAAAFVADQLGFETPDVRLGYWNGQKGSLQEWRAGYTKGEDFQADHPQRFDEFWASQQRKDLDAMDYLTAQQDRHAGNIQLRDKGRAGFDLLVIDQDSSFPTSSARFHPTRTLAQLAGHQRPLPDTISKGMADRMRQLDATWPEADLRQWLTKPEVDGARARLTEIITGLNSGTIKVAP